ncbi:uncharacterized protein LOC116176574 isoform X2 [Photinus pyralis]|uniref:uncharacterized protein LOC116176574 isoform X2 n=1 Tax=Photinus pyralis TaxID=7054 RepID=UPI0012675AE7|nr:uncharacterized protein LOC116176574 isoform X2 [Photinus pyralis]
MAGKKRTSKEQFDIYVRNLEKNRLLVTGRLTPGMNIETLQQLWSSLAEELNSCGSGPIRKVESWKKIFTEWKSLVKKRAREGKLLTELEKRYLEATGVVSVTGMTSAKELGIASIEEKESQITNEDNVEIAIPDHQACNIEIELHDDIEVVPDEPHPIPSSVFSAIVEGKCTK